MEPIFLFTMKKFLAPAFLLLFTPFASADFSDTHGQPYREAVEFLLEEKVVEGFTDGTFRPDKDITRAEFLKIILKSKSDISDVCESEKEFSDVSGDDWFSPFVCYSLNNNIVQGYEDGTFRPHDSINVRDAAKIVSEVHELEVSENQEGEWFEGYITALNRERVMPGSIQDTAGLLKRGEMSEVVWGIATGSEVENKSLGDLPKIGSCRELQAQVDKFEQRSQKIGRRGGFKENERMEFGAFEDDWEGDDDDDNEDMLDFAAPAMEKSMENTAGASADGFSGTNLQEAGVDEADIIKNDGSHIFLIKRNKIRIIQAYPSEDMKEVSSIILKGNNTHPQDMFLDGDRLTVISSSGGQFYEKMMPGVMIDMPEIYPHPGGANEVTVTVFDVSDRTDPKELRTVSFEGQYVSSRRIGDTAYVIANKHWNYYNVPRPMPMEVMMPGFSDSTREEEIHVARCSDVRYIPNFEQQNYLIAMAIDTRNLAKKVDREVVLGGGGQGYSSSKNMYVTKGSYDEVFWEEESESGWRNEEGTDIYKFALKDGGINFSAKGRVRGRLLNQFSMSEWDNHFRIATQVGQAWGREKSNSIVTILDSNLKETGKIDGIAPGENLKSARFMGKRGFLVTFKTVDPLFVLDLDPSNPKVLGKLKIPGWSDYLHPYDEDHLIGFGKEVDESIDADKVHSDSAIYYTAVLGMKLAIFDISDLSDPKEIHKEVIGYRDTTSEVLRNHKALLFDKEKGILGFPITLTENKNGKHGYEADVETVFSGAHVYDISLEDGFSLRGKVSHYEGEESYLKSGDYFYGDHDSEIQRMIYIGESFYSISPNIISALGWDDLALENRIELDRKTCAEIQTESGCVSRTDCRAIYDNESECERDFGGDIICVDDPFFSNCESAQ